MRNVSRLYAVLILMVMSGHSVADGNTVDKVYTPYVQLLERELEYRAIVQHDNSVTLDDKQKHKFAYGQSLSDRLFIEAYVIGKHEPSSDFSVDALEIALKIQLSEQGEYNNDWGLIFELERELADNFWEVSSVLIGLHEWSNWQATANISVTYEFGEGIKNEVETGFSGQLKYRYKQTLEPAIELYLAEDTQAIGPVLTGVVKLGGGKKLRWNTGLLFGLSATTPNTSVKFNLEYEF